MVGQEPSSPTEPKRPSDLELIEMRDARLEEDGGVPLDPRWFIPEKCTQPLTMNTISKLPLYAREHIMHVLTKDGKDELEYRLYLREHPRYIPEHDYRMKELLEYARRPVSSCINNGTSTAVDERLDD